MLPSCARAVRRATGGGPGGGRDRRRDAGSSAPPARARGPTRAGVRDRLPGRPALHVHRVRHERVRPLALVRHLRARVRAPGTRRRGVAHDHRGTAHDRHGRPRAERRRGRDARRDGRTGRRAGAAAHHDRVRRRRRAGRGAVRVRLGGRATAPRSPRLPAARARGSLGRDPCRRPDPPRAGRRRAARACAPSRARPRPSSWRRGSCSW